MKRLMPINDELLEGRFGGIQQANPCFGEDIFYVVGRADRALIVTTGFATQYLSKQAQSMALEAVGDWLLYPSEKHRDLVVYFDLFLRHAFHSMVKWDALNHHYKGLHPAKVLDLLLQDCPQYLMELGLDEVLLSTAVWKQDPKPYRLSVSTMPTAEEGAQALDTISAYKLEVFDPQHDQEATVIYCSSAEYVNWLTQAIAASVDVPFFPGGNGTRPDVYATGLLRDALLELSNIQWTFSTARQDTSVNFGEEVNAINERIQLLLARAEGLVPLRYQERLRQEILDSRSAPTED